MKWVGNAETFRPIPKERNIYTQISHCPVAFPAGFPVLSRERYRERLYSTLPRRTSPYLYFGMVKCHKPSPAMMCYTLSLRASFLSLFFYAVTFSTRYSSHTYTIDVYVQHLENKQIHRTKARTANHRRRVFNTSNR